MDGFRFDLASVLARDAHGNVQTDEPAVVNEIGGLAVQLDVRLVAEAWDIGAYLLGRSFPGLAWRQWNGQLSRRSARIRQRAIPARWRALMTPIVRQ